MKKEVFDIKLARAYCMNYGMVVGLLCGASFLCAMYANGSILLSQLGNILAVFAFIATGLFIRQYGRQTLRLSLAQASYMAMMTYIFAIMITAVVQYLYFQFLDNGRLCAQLDQLTMIPEYRHMLTQVSGSIDVDEMVKEIKKLAGNSIVMTMNLMWMNLLFAAILTLPTAILGRRK